MLRDRRPNPYFAPDGALIERPEMLHPRECPELTTRFKDLMMASYAGEMGRGPVMLRGLDEAETVA